MPQHSLFDVSPEHIAAFDDEGLRLLITRLCEADLRRRGFPQALSSMAATRSIAADGGIDVRIELPADTDISGFIPRPATGFQAKADDMPAGEIEKEMRPKTRQTDGTKARCLRPSIRALAEVGAYVIVSSKGSTADSRLIDRRDAMRAAVVDLDHRGDLHLDFYDRTRMATWVCEYPGEILWVQARIGQLLPGWRPIGISDSKRLPEANDAGKWQGRIASTDS